MRWRTDPLARGKPLGARSGTLTGMRTQARAIPSHATPQVALGSEYSYKEGQRFIQYIWARGEPVRAPAKNWCARGEPLWRKDIRKGGITNTS